MNYCKDCRHYEPHGNSFYSGQACRHPKVIDYCRIVVGNETPAEGVFAGFPRWQEALCGIEGKWFEVKP